MTRHITIAAFFAVLMVASNAAYAMYPSPYGWGYYSGPGTVESAARHGMAHQMEAYGQMQKSLSEADEIQARADSAYSDLAYKQAEQYFQAEQMKLELKRQKREDRIAQQTASAAAEETAAIRLWKGAQQGVVNWPSALTRPEYSTSMSMVESILRNWSPNDPASSASYRRALATEAASLRAKISGNKNIDFRSQVQAVNTLKQLQLLASSTDLSTVGPQLAMR